MSYSELKKRPEEFDWIDEFPSIQVDVEFCNWLAEYYGVSTPRTDQLVRNDRELRLGLYRWKTSLAIGLRSRDVDLYDGLIGGSGNSPVECFETWMTKSQAWRLWKFLMDAKDENKMIFEIRAL
jgi:hypothetical protein